MSFSNLGLMEGNWDIFLDENIFILICKEEALLYAAKSHIFIPNIMCSFR